MEWIVDDSLPKDKIILVPEFDEFHISCVEDFKEGDKSGVRVKTKTWIIFYQR